MNRYYSDSDDGFNLAHRQSDNIHASGWQSPLPATNVVPLSSVIRLIVECPFGSQKCDYTIDKSERGRLTVTARRRHTLKSDYFSSNKKDNIAVQKFTIPPDADVDHLNSFVERHTKRLIIEIPRLSSSSSYINSNQVPTEVIRSSNVLKSSTDPSQVIFDNRDSSRNYYDNNQKLEYVIDCDGYTADELDVYIQGYDLIVQGTTARARPLSPTRKHTRTEFSRKISLPNTVDTSRVISYFQPGQLRVQAPLKHEMYYSQDRMLSSGMQPVIVPDKTVVEYNQTQSTIPAGRQHHYRRQERVSRHREYDPGDYGRSLSPVQRIYSTEGFHHPMYRSFRDLNDEDAIRPVRHQRRVNYERYVTHRNDTQLEPMRRSAYSSRNNIVRPISSHQHYPMNETKYFRY